MVIKTVHQSVKVLFEQNATFEVPKYQRGYAWDDDAIEDFIDDISKCLEAHSRNGKRHHFFGGIVTTRKDVSHSSRSNYEVVDGQQRLASFVMLAATIVRSMEEIVAGLIKQDGLGVDEKKARTYLTETIDSLKGLYLYYRDNIELEYVDVPKLRLSEADNAFFQATIAGNNLEPTRASHKRILDAWSRLRRYLKVDVLNGLSASKKAIRLQELVNGVLPEDCTVIFMCSDTRDEAYQIFQVLNDRGVHLTDGDLLRARTLEVLDQRELSAIQEEVATCWDRVLAYPPQDIDSYLRWYYSSFEGKRPKSSDLAGQFLERRFSSAEANPLGESEAKAILDEVKSLDTEFVFLEILRDGDWPYSDQSTVYSWDRERLRALVVHLKHTNAMPLLLALRLLDAKEFADAVAILERFVFRYKTIGNAHISPATGLYLRHASKIRSTNTYAIKDLKNDLATLVSEKVPDGVFEARLRELKYSERSGNAPIRYLLIALEDYSMWYEQGAQGSPKCRDKTRVFDFSNTTIEHIYPQSVDAEDKDAGLEEIKHTLGNLTIFGPDDNDKQGNRPFLKKRDVLVASNLKLNRDLGNNDQWTEDKVNERTNQLVKMAVRVFVP